MLAYARICAEMFALLATLGRKTRPLFLGILSISYKMAQIRPKTTTRLQDEFYCVDAKFLTP